MEEMNLKDENNKKLLESISQTSNNILNVHSVLISKTVSDLFKKHLEEVKQELYEIKSECDTLSKTLNISLQDINWFKKTRINAMICFNTLIDDSTENLARILISELNKSVMDIIKAIDNAPNAINEILKISGKLKDKLDKQMNNTRKFLVKDPSSYNKKEENKKKTSSKNIKRTSKETIKQAKK